MQVSRCLARSDTGTCVMVEDPVNLVISDAMLNVSLGQDSASGDFVQVIIMTSVNKRWRLTIKVVVNHSRKCAWHSKYIASASKCVIASLEQCNMQCAYFDESLRTMRHHN